MELDHVIVFVAGPESVAPLFPGFVLDPGIRHVGQGTCNRRVFFPRNYVEIVWIEDSEARRRSGLGGAARWAPGAPCPFGVVLRGIVGEHDRERYEPYQVPAGGPALLLLGSALHDPRQPFVAVREDGVRLGAGYSAAPERRPGHPTCAVAQPTIPDVGTASPRDVRFELGRARLRLEWDGPVAPWEHPDRNDCCS